MAEENLQDLIMELRQEIHRLNGDLEKWRDRIIDLVDSYDAILKKPELASEYRQAFNKVRSDLVRTVKALGLDVIDVKPGEPFDEALHKIEDENRAPGADPSLVHSVVRAGYRVGSEVIRPCEVVVGYVPAPEPAAVSSGATEQPVPPQSARQPKRTYSTGSPALFEQLQRAAERNKTQGGDKERYA